MTAGPCESLAKIELISHNGPNPTTTSAVRGGASLGTYETPIDKMLSLPPQRVTPELVPDQGAMPVPTDYRAPSEGT
jgi:hypothetical protein